MNISYNWLKDFLDFNLTPQQTADILTSIGLENGKVSEVELIKGGLKGLVVGKVLTCTDHPDSDHLHVTTVDTGDKEPLNIVCGAPNVAAGQKVIVATVGTKLYDGDKEFIIKKSKIRGKESYGMICAEDEIGVGTSHEGIIVLPDNAVIGTSAAEYYGLESEPVLEVDITPNRSDGISHYGVARDLAAYLMQENPELKLKRPSVDAFKVDDNSWKVNVEVENNEACPRYSGITISGITVKESPKWLKDRLTVIGLNPINNVVDITNYLLHETGQPLHAFNGDKIKGDTIKVGTVKDGTPFVTLDGEERKLSSSDLMICNNEEPMCIAGVFGGKDAGVTESTTKVFIESAYFNPVWIRKTARRHGLNTDASFRYERGIDPNNTIYVLKRAAMMIKELAGGKITCDPVDIYPNPINDFEVSLSLKKVNALIGKEISKDKILSILRALEMKIVSDNGDVIELKVPPYRADVKRDVDVIEDILRIYGYNNVDFNETLNSSIIIGKKPDSHRISNIISEQLTACGFNEIMNNSLTPVSYYENLKSYPAENCVKLLNPLSNDLNVMRQTMLFGGLECIARNINHRRPDLKFYEYGSCYHYNEDNKTEEDVLSSYSEEKHFSLWITGAVNKGNWMSKAEKSTVFHLKAYVEGILERFGIQKSRLLLEEEQNDIFSYSLKYKLKGSKGVLLQLGGVCNSILKNFDISSEVFFADIVWDEFIKAVKRTKISFTELPKFPEVKRDLALLVDKGVSFSNIEKTAYSSEKKLLKQVSLFDVYEGKNIAEDKKSYAVSFILQDMDKTLKDKQIDAVMTKLAGAFRKELNAELR